MSLAVNRLVLKNARNHPQDAQPAGRGHVSSAKPMPPSNREPTCSLRFPPDQPRQLFTSVVTQSHGSMLDQAMHYRTGCASRGPRWPPPLPLPRQPTSSSPSSLPCPTSPSAMPRSSLDGRRRKKAEKAPEAAELPAASMSCITTLKEASPPKTNPWQRAKAPTPSPQPMAQPVAQPAPQPASASLNQNDWPRAQEAAAATKQDPVNKPVESVRATRRRTVSASSSSSREFLQAAAARAGERLWNFPFGADILLFAEDKVLQVHRSVVAPKSGWIRDKLLPPHANGAPVGVYFGGAAKIIGHSLKFIYTDRLEPCEPSPESPSDITHVACCSLFYLVAVDLRIPTMASHILNTLVAAMDRWRTLLDTHFARQPMSRQEGMEIRFYLQDALDAAYAYPYPDLVAPLRLALAGFLDTMLPLIVRCPMVINLLSSVVWQHYSRLITADMMEHRRRVRCGQVPTWSLPGGQTLEALFDKAPKRGYDVGSWPSAGLILRASAGLTQR